MRKMMSRANRTAVAIVAVAFMASGVVVAGATTASADGCVGPLCGAVKNRTGRTMHYTTSLGDGPHFCDVWNWDGGTGSKFKHAECEQKSFGNGTVGGNGTGKDVDAFTFATHGYHERFSRVGTWHWRQKGVWTKIRSGEIADCGIGDNNEVWCTVLVQA
ncbi:hypothetical protein SGFS_011670 [Streptomyces graminofaciens]|jgi:hypothetical protein|uniref:Secreted protein n=1 Tax=Streptomyces graminofaciens TaxID=68212 RepID=A0ABM7F272_9ACTN|nr:hypothetical protein [Streptomyces graminofaciens]BBC29873.1 hypothetical protein SGFS_011670 [Streptomyces graminofaciens]